MTDVSSRTSRFVGRKRELRVLDEILGAAGDGEGAVVLVAGAAGVGKTRFCREVAARARHGGYTVAWGSCWPAGGAPPLWPWQQILGELGETATELFAADSGGSIVDPERFARFTAIAARIDAACALSPVLVVIDDIDSADAGAMLLGRFIARTLAQRPLILLLTRRTEPDGLEAASPAWAVETEATLVALGCFDLAETETMLRTRGGVVDRELLGTVFQLTGGHPLHLQQVVAAGGASGALSSGGVRAAIAWAVGRLSDKTREILSRAAVLGADPAIVEAGAVGNVTLSAVRTALDEAAGASLAASVSGSDHFSFTHELVREALLRRLTVEAELDAHARAAEMLSTGPAGDTDRLVRLARHALLAAPRSAADARRAVAACQCAARAAMAGFGYEYAADLLASAATVHQRGGLPDPVAPLLVLWAEAVLQCGRLAEARQLFDRAAEVATAEGDAVALAGAAVGLGGMWVNEHRSRVDRERVVGMQQRVLAGLPSGELGLRRRLEVRLAAEAVYQGGPVEPALAALDRARRLGDSRALAEALSLVHHALLTPRHTHQRLALADELIAVASAAGEGMFALLGLCWRTVDLFHLGDGRAQTALAELRERADTVGCLSLRHVAESMETMLLIRAGQLDQAEAKAYECFQLGTDAGDADALAFLAAHLTTIRWLQGRDVEMLEMVEQVAGSPTLNPAEFAFQATAANLAARAGQTGKARAAVDRLIAPGLADLPESSTWLGGMLAIVEAARALGDAGLARQAYDLLTPYADLPLMPSLAVTCFGSVERVLGVAALTYHDPDRAVEHLQRSVGANRLLANRPVTAMANADLAEALLHRNRPGDRDRARAVLAEACEEAEALALTGRAPVWRRRLTDLASQTAILRHDRRHWTLDIGSRQTVVADRLGIRYLARLLTNPGRQLSALELVSDPSSPAPAPALRQALLDEDARIAYRRRVNQLTEELAGADVRGDQQRSLQLQAELDELLDELRRATGKGGRPRAFSDAGERARTAVRKAIKRAIDEISAGDADLGALLDATVTTGNICGYTPDPQRPLHWTLVDTSPQP